MNKYLVIDVETAGGFGNPLVYDIGYRITDTKGRIYVERSFLIKEIFTDFSLMRSAYYKEKVPAYIKAWRNGEFEAVTFRQVKEIILQDIAQNRVNFICAYNAKFDMNALDNTALALLGESVFFPDEIEVYDIWGMVCETLALQKRFFKNAIENNWESNAGNVRTSAEILWRYLSGNAEFEEAHTGLADVEIECAIMLKCFAQHKKMTRTIIVNPWKIPQPHYKEYKFNEMLNAL